MKHHKKYIFLIGSIIVLAVFTCVAIYGGVYFYRQYKKTENVLKDPVEAAKKEAKEITANVSKLMILPEDEPTIATIADAEKLKTQPFFMDAQNGDKVLIYAKAKKAILYRPSLNIIVEVAPLVIGNTNQDAVSQVKIALRNGTEKAGATKILEDELVLKIKNIIITGRDSAKRRDYKETTVIDLSGNNKQVADELANTIDARVGIIPKGEDVPGNSDLLIIIGSDRK